ncbi:MAG: hypothetical protein AB7G13_08320 [Lautropia sp.]
MPTSVQSTDPHSDSDRSAATGWQLAGSSTFGPGRPLPRAFVGTQGAYEHICAYGMAMGWADKPFDFVVQQWLASRSENSNHCLLTLPR